MAKMQSGLRKIGPGNITLSAKVLLSLRNATKLAIEIPVSSLVLLLLIAPANCTAGSVVLRLRRPAYLINSTIYIENGDGEVIGEVRQKWHLWQRNYDVFLDRRQIAAINSPLLAWEFALKDESGGEFHFHGL